MSVRTGTNNNYQRTTSPPPRTSYTFCGWAKLVSQVGSFDCLAALEDATGSATNGIYIGIESGVGLVVYDSGGRKDFGDATDYDNNTWFFFAIIGNGGSVDAWARLEGEASLTSRGASMSQNSFTSVALFLGSDSFHEDFGGELRYCRMWDAVLNSTELQAESVSTTHVRTSNINAVYAFNDTSDDENDTSGNSRTLTVNGTPTNGASEPSITVGGGLTPIPIAYCPDPFRPTTKVVSY